MASPRALLRSEVHPEATRVILICADLRRVATYQRFLVADGFEVLTAFDVDTALDTCRRSLRGVKAAVILTQGEPGRDEALVRNISFAAPSIPCVLVPAETSPSDCAVLIRIAMRCTVGSLRGA